MKIIILFHLKKIRLRCSIWEDFIKLQADALGVSIDEIVIKNNYRTDKRE